ncbi:unnamed protein product [Linum tenue]|uniref:Uncharacterized protein n=1 Tax=Linum tenue TaxID=586396 RepID=A0AAV0M9Y5_9ROSI|nr:unnamed protein product [Linum tenue]
MQPCRDRDEEGGIWILDLRIGGCGGRIIDQWREDRSEEMKSRRRPSSSRVVVLPPSPTFCLRRRDWWVAGCDTATGGEWRDEETRRDDGRRVER